MRAVRMKGKVYLVGAGPGHAELVTVKACRVLGEADVVLHDDLVNPEILQFASASAHVENVGKRCGRAHASQAEIHSKMIAFANRGLAVVRLKGGDPLLFGRAGEEMEALREAGIEFEVVPGVTAACAAAAAARISLTDRRFASKLTILTNHRCGAKTASLEGTVDENTTVIVYMPGTNYQELSARLIEASFAPDTPCVIVSSATSDRQEIRASALADLAEMTNLPAPALLIVGRVAGEYQQGQSVVRAAAEPCVEETREQA